MKRTIKQWCIANNIGWLGQGSIGSLRYDWKIVLGKGRVAIFSNTVKGLRPTVQSIGKREILVFPSVNKPKGGGKISETAFLRIVAWVQDCLDGNIREFNSSNQASGATSDSAPGAGSSAPQG